MRVLDTIKANLEAEPATRAQYRAAVETMPNGEPLTFRVEASDSAGIPMRLDFSDVETAKRIAAKVMRQLGVESRVITYIGDPMDGRVGAVEAEFLPGLNWLPL